MTFPTSVNDQITDSVTQTNVKALDHGPAMAMGNLVRDASHSLASTAPTVTNTSETESDTAERPDQAVPPVWSIGA